MAKRNYKEDLDFILRLKDSCGREFSSFPDYDFTAKFYTSHMLNNLGDNTGKATKRIQMGATNIAKLTDADIAVATAKNYTVS